jgi:hypothetical protein
MPVEPGVCVQYEDVPVRLPVDYMRDDASHCIAGWKPGWRRKEIRTWNDVETGAFMGEWRWV